MEVIASHGKQCNTANIRIQTKAIGQASWRNVTGGNPQPPQTSRNSLRASWVEVWLGDAREIVFSGAVLPPRTFGYE